MKKQKIWAQTKEELEKPANLQSCDSFINSQLELYADTQCAPTEKETNELSFIQPSSSSHAALNTYSNEKQINVWSLGYLKKKKKKTNTPVG